MWVCNVRVANLTDGCKNSIKLEKCMISVRKAKADWIMRLQSVPYEIRKAASTSLANSMSHPMFVAQSITKHQALSISSHVKSSAVDVRTSCFRSVKCRMEAALSGATSPVPAWVESKLIIVDEEWTFSLFGRRQKQHDNPFFDLVEFLLRFHVQQLTALFLTDCTCLMPVCVDLQRIAHFIAILRTVID